MPNAHPRWGVEFNWLAVDRDHHVGLFMTSGAGPSPLAALRNWALIDSATARLADLPAVTGFVGDKAPHGVDYTCYDEPASRGLYCYDWRDSHGPYQLRAAPEQPLAVDALPDDLRVVASLASFDIRFSDAAEITMSYVEP
jgi:hypothetical protein